MLASKRCAFLQDLRRLLLVAGLILAGRSVLADGYVVPTGSMKPTILEGDRVFVFRAAGVFWSWDPEWRKGPRLKRFGHPLATEPDSATPVARKRREWGRDVASQT